MPIYVREIPVAKGTGERATAMENQLREAQGPIGDSHLVQVIRIEGEKSLFAIFESPV
jgi:hypothetical protein